MFGPSSVSCLKFDRYTRRSAARAVVEAFVPSENQLRQVFRDRVCVSVFFLSLLILNGGVLELVRIAWDGSGVVDSWRYCETPPLLDFSLWIPFGDRFGRVAPRTVRVYLEVRLGNLR